MQNRHESILRTVNRKDKKYNILTFPTHERWQSNLAGMDHTFYLFQAKGIKGWNNKYAQLPKNHILLDGSDNQVMPDMKFDIVFSQNKYGQYQQARAFSEFYGIPLVSIEHTLPYVGLTEKSIKKIGQSRGHVDVFISEYSAKEWLFDIDDPRVKIVHHGIDTNKFRPDYSKRENTSISVVNDIINRDWCCGFKEWYYINTRTNNFIVGSNPGLSLPAESEDDLVKKYNSASVFVNTSKISPVPMALLEAMSCGLAPVSLNNCMIPEIIQNGENGYLTNNLEEFVEIVNNLNNNPEKSKKIGENARKTILEKFSLEKHIQSWNNIFNNIVGKELSRIPY